MACKMVQYAPQNAETIYHVTNAYLEQYGEINLMLGTMICTCIMTSLFPKVGHAITYMYLVIMITYVGGNYLTENRL